MTQSNTSKNNKLLNHKINKINTYKNRGVELILNGGKTKQKKSFHAFFDYWHGTHISMMKSGRVLYNWPEDAGGIPPNLSNICTEKEKVRPFYGK